MNKLALAVIVVSIVIGVAVAGFLETEGLSTPTKMVACGPSQGCSVTTLTISSSTITESSSSQSVSRSECAASPAPKGNSSFTITETANEWPSCDCALVASNSYGMLYVSTDANVGDLVCLAASLNDSDTVAFTITNSTGSVVLQSLGCISSGGLGASPSTGVSCETDWDTAAPGESGGAVTVGAGAVTPGTYTLAATAGQGSPAVLEANFTLG